jgi:dCMP deaminase
MRVSKNKNYMDIAETIAQRSHDEETKVGAVLVNNESGAIMSTGYNGFVKGANDEALPKKRPEKYEYMLHAEANLICNAARHGVSMNNSTLICTMSPCSQCMRLLINCGITKVIAKNLYRDFNDIVQMKDVNIALNQDDEGFWHITYTSATNDTATT